MRSYDLLSKSMPSAQEDTQSMTYEKLSLEDSERDFPMARYKTFGSRYGRNIAKTAFAVIFIITIPVLVFVGLKFEDEKELASLSNKSSTNSSILKKDYSATSNRLANLTTDLAIKKVPLINKISSTNDTNAPHTNISLTNQTRSKIATATLNITNFNKLPSRIHGEMKTSNIGTTDKKFSTKTPTKITKLNNTNVLLPKLKLDWINQNNILTSFENSTKFVNKISNDNFTASEHKNLTIFGEKMSHRNLETSTEENNIPPKSINGLSKNKTGLFLTTNSLLIDSPHLKIKASKISNSLIDTTTNSTTNSHPSISVNLKNEVSKDNDTSTTTSSTTNSYLSMSPNLKIEASNNIYKIFDNKTTLDNSNMGNVTLKSNIDREFANQSTFTMETTSKPPVYKCLTRSGWFCSVPFIYLDKVYHGCGKNGMTYNWCATSIDNLGRYKSWDYCLPGWNCNL